MEKQIGIKRTKTVNTEEYLGILKELTEKGEKVNLLITGNSMSPFLIHLRDQVYFEKPGRPLKRGDIVFYQRSNGQYIMHRICRIDKSGYYMAGDAQTEIEGPLSRQQIFALVTAARRKEKLEQPGTFWWEFFEHVWISCIPLRPVVRSLYVWISRLIGRNRRQQNV